MSCNCETYTCLDFVRQYNNCPEFITVRVQASDTSTYSWEYEFNGRWNGGSIDVTSGENIVLPWVFNEHYVHTIKFYDAEGNLLNNTCYKLDTRKVPGTYTTPDVGSSNYLKVMLTDGMLSINDDNEQVITIAAIDSGTIVFIGDGNQVYSGASFQQTGTSFTMKNGASFYAGQIITLLFG